MNTAQETIALPDLAATLGITIETSAPSAGVEPKQGKEGREWPHIAYSVTLKRNGRDLWKGPYKLGVGHVKTPPKFEQNPPDLTQHEVHALNGMRRTPYFTPEPKLAASVAAKLAKAQKVAPKLPDVLHSLIMDGSPYFQGASFEEWAEEYGHDTDSRSAEKTYAACMETGRQMSRAFTDEELAQLQEAASEY